MSRKTKINRKTRRVRLIHLFLKHSTKNVLNSNNIQQSKFFIDFSKILSRLNGYFQINCRWISKIICGNQTKISSYTSNN